MSNLKAIRMLAFGCLLSGYLMVASAQDSTQPPPAPDNTKMNQGDSSPSKPNPSKPTADQQTSNQSDMKITQQIRQSIMKDKSLSTYAHNVKIITKNGMVVVKGPVGSDDERQKVEDAATGVVGKDNVTSELTIKPKQ